MKEENAKTNAGLRQMIKQGKEMFRIPENTDFYSEEHYKLAEKKFIKFCVIGGKC